MNLKDEQGKHQLMGFWECTASPYFLGGPIESFNDDGKIKVQGFPGFVFSPVIVVPYERGEKILADLRSIEAAYSKELSELIAKHNKQALALFVKT